MKPCISAPLAPGSAPLVLGALRWGISVVSHPPCWFSPPPQTVCWVCLLSGSLSCTKTFRRCFNTSYSAIALTCDFFGRSFSTDSGGKKKSMQKKVVQVFTVCGYLNIKGQWCVPVHAFWCVFIVSLSNVLPLRSSSDISGLKYSQVVLLIVWSRNQRFAWKSIEVHYFKSQKANH